MNQILQNKPSISVLMSVYNGDKWLNESIQSILNQTFFDFEFIIVNDGSTDRSIEIIKDFARADDRIVIIDKPNTGLADSLNRGIEQARGEWIARLDADDLCEPTRLEEQLNFVRNHPKVVLLGSCCIEIDQNGSVLKKHIYPPDHNRLVRHLKRSMRFFPHSSAFYRADLVRQMGGYNPRFRRAQDHDLWLRLSERGKLACLRDPFVKLRKHDGQISHDQGGMRQLCDATAANVCHILRASGALDPSKSSNDKDWSSFLEWIETRIDEEGVFEKDKAWTEARAAYFSAGHRLIGALRFGIRLLQSGHAGSLVWKKLFGSSLPERLAREWRKRTCAGL